MQSGLLPMDGRVLLLRAGPPNNSMSRLLDDLQVEDLQVMSWVERKANARRSQHGAARA